MNANCAIFQAAKYTKMHFKVKIMIHPARTFSLNISDSWENFCCKTATVFIGTVVHAECIVFLSHRQYCNFRGGETTNNINHNKQ